MTFLHLASVAGGIVMPYSKRDRHFYVLILATERIALSWTMAVSSPTVILRP